MALHWVWRCTAVKAIGMVTAYQRAPDFHAEDPAPDKSFPKIQSTAQLWVTYQAREKEKKKEGEKTSVFSLSLALALTVHNKQRRFRFI